MSEAALFQSIAKDLYTAVLSDVLDELGYRDQAMPPAIRPLDDALVMAGRARTGAYREVYGVVPGVNPYALEIALVDDLKAGDVAVLGCGGSTRIAPWGELLSTAARARGAAGCLTDGFVRDVKFIRKMQFPVFHGGIAPLDSKGRARIMALDTPVACGGVSVASGDLIFGDADGVVVIPQKIEAEVLALAFDKIKGEKNTLRDLQRGDKLADVFARYGIL